MLICTDLDPSGLITYSLIKLDNPPIYYPDFTGLIFSFKEPNHTFPIKNKKERCKSKGMCDRFTYFLPEIVKIVEHV